MVLENAGGPLTRAMALREPSGVGGILGFRLPGISRDQFENAIRGRRDNPYGPSLRQLPQDSPGPPLLFPLPLTVQLTNEEIGPNAELLS
jgi:hypothetical protein